MFWADVPLERIQHLLGHDSVTTIEIYIKARLPDVSMPNMHTMEDVVTGGGVERKRNSSTISGRKPLTGYCLAVEFAEKQPVKFAAALLAAS